MRFLFLLHSSHCEEVEFIQNLSQSPIYYEEFQPFFLCRTLDCALLVTLIQALKLFSYPILASDACSCRREFYGPLKLADFGISNRKITQVFFRFLVAKLRKVITYDVARERPANEMLANSRQRFGFGPKKAKHAYVIETVESVELVLLRHENNDMFYLLRRCEMAE